MELQHNTQDPGSKVGNSIKLTMGNLMDDEAECYSKKNPENNEDTSKIIKKSLDDLNWDMLIPR